MSQIRGVEKQNQRTIKQNMSLTIEHMMKQFNKETHIFLHDIHKTIVVCLFFVSSAIVCCGYGLH